MGETRGGAPQGAARPGVQKSFIRPGFRFHTTIYMEILAVWQKNGELGWSIPFHGLLRKMVHETYT